jgi:hypothetical protein
MHPALFSGSARSYVHELENVADFLDGLRVLMCGVAGRHDKLGLRAFHVRTPVRQHTVAGIWCVAFAAVPYNRVISDAGRDRDRVDRFHETVVWREGIHAIRNALELQVAEIKDANF